MPTAASINNALILEEPFIRTPYELLRRSHRSAQRQVEKDFTAITSALQNILKTLPPDPKSEDGKAAIIGKLDQAADRARGLKRKLGDLQPSVDQPSQLRARVAHLGPAVANGASGSSTVALQNGSVSASGTSSPSPRAAVTDTTLDRYIIDYLLRTGRMAAAQAVKEKHGLELLVDTKLFAELLKIENALTERQSVAEALAWCGENRGTLKKTKNNLEFALRLQEFIELCRKRDIQAAIAYSRKNLAHWAPTHMVEIQQGMTLLAFGEKTGVGMYRNLYNRSRWEVVRVQFRETFLSLYAQPSQPVLSLALSAGLSALRLPSCASSIATAEVDLSSDTSTTPRSPIIPLLPAAPPLHNIENALFPDLAQVHFHHHPLLPHAPAIVDTGHGHLGTTNDNEDAKMSMSVTAEDLHQHPDLPTGNVDCPTCAPDLGVLASECAMSHHVNSTIVCRISGKVMDSENEPMAFPNGYVYSAKALKEMAKNNFDVVTCPRTRDSCLFGRLRKVYIS